MKILGANADAYQALVVSGPAPALAHELLDGVTADQLVVPNSSANAAAMLAGLWLWHDGLDESHRISQNLSDRTGSFLHAIMHRREGDFGNSKYWYARAAGHPALATLGAQAPGMVHSLPADKSLLRIIINGFDPAALVDLVEKVADKPGDSLHRAAVALQQLEWRILFDYCWR